MQLLTLMLKVHFFRGQWVTFDIVKLFLQTVEKIYLPKPVAKYLNGNRFWYVWFSIARVLRISSISQYAGDEAAAWFSTLLNVPGCKMYQIHEPRYSNEEEKWGDIALPGDKVTFLLAQRCIL